MEIAAASTTSNALRIGLTLAVANGRPDQEFYFEVHNKFEPAERIGGFVWNVWSKSIYPKPFSRFRSHDGYGNS